MTDTHIPTHTQNCEDLHYKVFNPTTSSRLCVCMCICVKEYTCVFLCALVCCMWAYVWPANRHSDTGLSGRIRVRRLISRKPDRHPNTHSKTHTQWDNTPPHISYTARPVTWGGGQLGVWKENSRGMEDEGGSWGIKKMERGMRREKWQKRERWERGQRRQYYYGNISLWR